MFCTTYVGMTTANYLEYLPSGLLSSPIDRINIKSMQHLKLIKPSNHVKKKENFKSNANYRYQQ